jgi:serine/threonine protein kinase
VIGKRLSHYLIIEQVGAGGMGVVYRARDERLDRDVALKILSPSLVADDAARKRLRREALILSKLNHAHINLIYDVDSEDGVDFLVMEFIRGETLSHRLEAGSFSEPDVLSIGIQVAEALEEAHRSGIVHRDLAGKRDADRAGRCKVLISGWRRRWSRITREWRAAGGRACRGTLPYIALEQFRGRHHARSDIYSLAVFTRSRPASVRPSKRDGHVPHPVLKDPPKNPSAIVPGISPALEGVILKALAKDPDRRYATAGEVVDALQGAGATRTTLASTRTSRRRRRWVVPVVTATAVAVAAALVVLFHPGDGAYPKAPRRIESLAVLPLDDLSGDSKQAYFADGMTDALITRLAQISSLRVISRTSVMGYRGAGKSLPQIARDLHVDAVVEGTVLRSGDQVRISAELVEAAVDRHLWANTYEREIGDGLARGT